MGGDLDAGEAGASARVHGNEGRGHPQRERTRTQGRAAAAAAAATPALARSLAVRAMSDVSISYKSGDRDRVVRLHDAGPSSPASNAAPGRDRADTLTVRSVFHVLFGTPVGLGRASMAASRSTAPLARGTTRLRLRSNGEDARPKACSTPGTQDARISVRLRCEVSKRRTWSVDEGDLCEMMAICAGRREAE